MEKISFEDYDRITDVLMYLSDTVSLNFTVALSRKSKTNERSFFQFETKFQSKYIGQEYGRSIKRSMNYYFVLDDKNNFGNGFLIRPQDVYIIAQLIETKLFPLFFDPTKRIFKIKENRLFIVGEYKPIVYPQTEYKVLIFEPIVIEYNDGFKEGVRLRMNDSQVVDIDIDKFLGFYYTITNTDMYGTACVLVNYVKIPPYGINIYNPVGLAGGGPSPEEEWSGPSTRKGGNNNFLSNL